MSEKQLKHFQNKQAYFQAVPTSFRQVLGLSVPRCGKKQRAREARGQEHTDIYTSPETGSQKRQSDQL